MNLILRIKQSLNHPMRLRHELLFIASVGVSIVIAGCSSSGSSQQEATQASPDSASAQLTGQGQPAGHLNGRKSSRARNQQGFVTQEDTIEAEVVTRNHTTGHVKPPAKGSSKKKFYSVQVGAFRELSNANHAKKVAQERYKRTVYHFYEKGIKMYRVTVGNFSKLNDGLAFLKKIQKEHPQEYKNAWVAEMRR